MTAVSFKGAMSRHNRDKIKSGIKIYIYFYEKCSFLMDKGDVKCCGVHAKREVGGDGQNPSIAALIKK